MNKRDVIIACDFKDRETTLSFLEKFPKEKPPFVKVGMELFYAEGPDIVKELRHRGNSVFLDLKLHDIPNTVKSAMRVIAALDVQITNLHASTSAMMQAAVEGIRGKSSGKDPLVVAVTQLTSTSEVSLRLELLIEHTMVETIKKYAKRAYDAGLDGVVCSPLEAGIVKEECGQDFITVTPGIRYPDGKTDDQSRVTTPKQAGTLGCDYIVVGRPIIQAEDPVAAYERILNEFIGG